MPRSNRPRRPRGGGRDEPPERDLTQIVLGGRRTEVRGGRTWNVQPVGGGSVKEYTCPGCHLVVEPGRAHVVVWRADGLFGDADDLAARRHWHTHCWRIA